MYSVILSNIVAVYQRSGFDYEIILIADCVFFINRHQKNMQWLHCYT